MITYEYYHMIFFFTVLTRVDWPRETVAMDLYHCRQIHLSRVRS